MTNSSTLKVPKYRKHAARDLGLVRLNGKDFYLGRYGTPESREAYDRLIAEWLANGRRLSQPNNASDDARPVLTINQVLLAFWKHAETYYVGDGVPSTELTAYKYAMRPVNELYGSTPAAEFGPAALKTIRQRLVDRDLSRRYINHQINRIRRIFKWAASEELVPIETLTRLQTVTGLRYRRSAARETEPVRPVDFDHVQAVLPYVTPQIAAMIQLQWWTGMRPGEVVIMCPRDIDRRGDIWIYRPSKHKTQYRGLERLVHLGPRAQALIEPFLNRSEDDYLFSPIESETWRNERRAVRRKPDRKTKIYPSELRARERRKKARTQHVSKRSKRDHFDRDSYRRAVEYGIAKANRNGQQVSHWHPHQLRHAHATEVRRHFGIEGAQVAMGHSHVTVTEVYAERNAKLAVKIASELG